LGAFIQHTEANIHLYLHSFHTFGFIGWYFENYPIIVDKIEDGEFFLHFVSDTEYVPFGAYEILGLQTSLFDDKTLTHIVPNSPPVIRDNEGNVWIVSGDISFEMLFEPQPVDEFDAAYDNWVSEVLRRGNVDVDDHIMFFISLGHFWENVNTHHYQNDENKYSIADMREKIHVANDEYTNLDVIFIHFKDNIGFSVDLYSPEEERG